MFTWLVDTEHDTANINVVCWESRIENWVKTLVKRVKAFSNQGSCVDLFRCVCCVVHWLMYFASKRRGSFFKTRWCKKAFTLSVFSTKWETLELICWSVTTEQTADSAGPGPYQGKMECFFTWRDNWPQASQTLEIMAWAEGLNETRFCRWFDCPDENRFGSDFQSEVDLAFLSDSVVIVEVESERASAVPTMISALVSCQGWPNARDPRLSAAQS